MYLNASIIIMEFIEHVKEPLNKGHVGVNHFVLCREVVHSSEVQDVLTIWENDHLK